MPSRSFVANYENKCVTCGQPILLGMMIRFAKKGSKDLEHETCPVNIGGALVVPHPPTPTPSTSKPGSGPSNGERRFIHVRWSIGDDVNFEVTDTIPAGEPAWEKIKELHSLAKATQHQLEASR